MAASIKMHYKMASQYQAGGGGKRSDQSPRRVVLENRKGMRRGTQHHQIFT